MDKKEYKHLQYIKHKEKAKEYYKKNILKKKLYDKEYCFKNKDKKSTISKKYYQQNKDLIINRTHEYYNINREKILQKTREKYHRDPITYLKRSRKNFLKKNFNITPEDIKRMKFNQNGLCKICKKNKAIHLDHNHKTNKIRAILCTKCNFGIGLFNDNIEILLSAIKYLKEYD